MIFFSNDSVSSLWMGCLYINLINVVHLYRICELHYTTEYINIWNDLHGVVIQPTGILWGYLLIITLAKITRLVHISNIQIFLVYKGCPQSIFHTCIYPLDYKQHEMIWIEYLLHMLIIIYIFFWCSDREHELFTFS